MGLLLVSCFFLFVVEFFLLCLIFAFCLVVVGGFVWWLFLVFLCFGVSFFDFFFGFFFFC